MTEIIKREKVKELLSTELEAIKKELIEIGFWYLPGKMNFIYKASAYYERGQWELTAETSRNMIEMITIDNLFGKHTSKKAATYYIIKELIEDIDDSDIKMKVKLASDGTKIDSILFEDKEDKFLYNFNHTENDSLIIDVTLIDIPDIG